MIRDDCSQFNLINNEILWHDLGILSGDGQPLLVCAFHVASLLFLGIRNRPERSSNLM